ncbi:MAG: hypothetical protein VSS75_019865, partial [Candidatus Parabeggiatoa sp.]|nr:hypothetical protein [Candidatus Parabeggiatoa sp.]
MMAMGSSASACGWLEGRRDFTCSAEITLTTSSTSPMYATGGTGGSYCCGHLCSRHVECKHEIQDDYLDNSLWDKFNLTLEQKYELCKKGSGDFSIHYTHSGRHDKWWDFDQSLTYSDCEQKCLYDNDGNSIHCETVPTGQKPDFDYPPTSIDPDNDDVLCGDDEVTLTTNPKAPQGYYVQWYRNGELWLGKTGQTIQVKGGKYQASYRSESDGTELGKSSEIPVQQCIQGTVRHDINNDGKCDASERPLPDVLIRARLQGIDNIGLTNDVGKYSFSSPPNGGFLIDLEWGDNPDYLWANLPIEPASANYMGSVPVYEDFDFCLKLPASISGTVRKDKNCNGENNGDFGIADLTVTANNFPGYTDIKGEYTVYLIDSLFGTDDATESFHVTPYSLGEGWITTFPASGEYNVSIKKNQTITGYDFLVSEAPSITGFMSSNKEVTSPAMTLAFPYDLPDQLEISRNGSVDGLTSAFNWVKPNSTAPLSPAEATAAGVYRVEYTDDSVSKCTVKANFEVQQGTVDSWYDIGAYCVDGTPTGSKYSWKITEENKTTALKMCKKATGTLFASGLSGLVTTFVNSINNTGGVNSSEDCSGTLSKIASPILPDCFALNPSNDFDLYVGAAFNEPSCLVDTTYCAYNPTIKKVVLKCALPPQEVLASFSLNKVNETY